MEAGEAKTVQDEAGAGIALDPIDPIDYFNMNVIRPVEAVRSEAMAKLATEAGRRRLIEEERQRLVALGVAQNRALAAALALYSGGGVAPVGSSALNDASVVGNVPSMPQMMPPIIGERNMRSTLIREGADAVRLTQHQKEMTRRWYENFKWVDEGFGNGNQERLPWDEKSGEYQNSLYRAEMVNQHIRYSGELFDGGQRLTPVPQLSAHGHYRRQIPMIPDVQNHQAMQRANALPAGAGRPIQFMRDNRQMTPKGQLFSKDYRLEHPQVIANERGVTRV
jgi:hypothetical protein